MSKDHKINHIITFEKGTLLQFAGSPNDIYFFDKNNNQILDKGDLKVICYNSNDRPTRVIGIEGAEGSYYVISKVSTSDMKNFRSEANFFFKQGQIERAKIKKSPELSEGFATGYCAKNNEEGSQVSFFPNLSIQVTRSRDLYKEDLPWLVDPAKCFNASAIFLLAGIGLGLINATVETNNTSWDHELIYKLLNFKNSEYGIDVQYYDWRDFPIEHLDLEH